MIPQKFPLQLRALAVVLSIGLIPPGPAPISRVASIETLRPERAGTEEIARILNNATASGLEELAGVQITEITLGQIAELLGFRERVFKAEVSWDGDFDEELFGRRLEALIRHEIPGALVVARDPDGTMIGYAVSYSKPPVNPTGEISELAVDPRYRKMGIAAELFARALEGLVRSPAVETVEVRDFSRPRGTIAKIALRHQFEHVAGSLGLYRLRLPPIALKSISGLPIFMRRGTKDRYQILEPNGQPWGNPPDVRTAGEMKRVLADPETVKSYSFGTVRDQTAAYWMYRDRALAADRPTASTHNLRYDVTVIAPSDDLHRFGTELVKTYGHYHPPRDPEFLPEIYEVLYGEAWFLLQKPSPTDPDVIEDIILVKAKAGEKAVMLPGYGHVTINPSATEPIVMANWVSSAFQSDYTEYQRHKGAAVYISLTGDASRQVQISPNPNYTALPEAVRITRPIPELKEFGFEKYRPMYGLIKTDPNKLQFLNTPEKFGPEFTRALASIDTVDVGGVMSAGSAAGLEESAQSVLGQDGRVTLPLRVFATPDDIGRYQADQIMPLWRAAAKKNQPFVLGLATGSTPEPLLRELVRRIELTKEGEAIDLLGRLYIVGMDDIVQSGQNVSPDHDHSAYTYFRDRFIEPLSQRYPVLMNGWIRDHLIVPTVGRVAQQAQHVIKDLGGVDWQLMATDPVEGHVAEVAPGERFGDREVQDRKDQSRELSAPFLEHNPWARGYQGITFTLDDFVAMLKPGGVVSFAAFGEAKKPIGQRLVDAKRYNPELPISFLWLEDWRDRGAQIELLFDRAAVPTLTGLEEGARTVARLFDASADRRAVVISRDGFFMQDLDEVGRTQYSLAVLDEISPSVPKRWIQYLRDWGIDEIHVKRPSSDILGLPQIEQQLPALFDHLDRRPRVRDQLETFQQNEISLFGFVVRYRKEGRGGVPISILEISRAGLEELDRAVTQATNRDASYLFGPSLPSDVLAMASALREHGVSQIVVLRSDLNTIDQQLDEELPGWHNERPFQELYFYCAEDDSVADAAMNRLSNAALPIHRGGVVDDPEEFFQSLLKSLGVSLDLLRGEPWTRLYQSLQSSAGLEQSV